VAGCRAPVATISVRTMAACTGQRRTQRVGSQTSEHRGQARSGPFRTSRNLELIGKWFTPGQQSPPKERGHLQAQASLPDASGWRLYVSRSQRIRKGGPCRPVLVPVAAPLGLPSAYGAELLAAAAGGRCRWPKPPGACPLGCPAGESHFRVPLTRGNAAILRLLLACLVCISFPAMSEDSCLVSTVTL
jgi:hypothetical protein